MNISPQKAWLVSLVWDIRFNDADDGDCYAGEGKKPVGLFNSEENANAFLTQWNLPISNAEKETIVFPIQPSSEIVKTGLGFTPYEIDDNGKGFTLKCEPISFFDNTPTQ